LSVPWESFQVYEGREDEYYLVIHEPHTDYSIQGEFSKSHGTEFVRFDNCFFPPRVYI
jgi:hypothetical protein